MRNPFRNPFGPFKQARGWAAPKVAEPKVNECRVTFAGVSRLHQPLRSDLFLMPKVQPVQANNWAVQGAAVDVRAMADRMREFLQQPAFMDLANVEARIALQLQEARDKQLFIDPDKLRGLRADMIWVDDLEGNLGGFVYKAPRVPESQVTAIRELDSWSAEFNIARDICVTVLRESNQLGVDMRNMGGDDLEFDWGDANKRELAKFFRQQVKNSGMIVYGGGNFSIAFGKKDSRRIYKWSVRKGDAGVHWNKLCKRKHTANQHLPKVFELHEFGNGMILMQTERLLSKHRYEEQCAERGENPKFDPWATDSLSDMLYDAWNSAAFESVQKQFGTSAALCLQRIGLWRDKNQLTGDLHSENFMFREDGTIVFTDPVAYVRGGDPDVTHF